ncbi:hypothetical protein UFOVP708_15 [uncultured Caudovirales phage]|uniref:Uncharacterized protein n=1 Tax=uncultured Caudovirales phage TaxID=2100421 RepID=A0A6J5NNS9_9CAUD|nr:hypothetical protein UFOVP708_15 [uncultured Caudovirales phage]
MSNYLQRIAYMDGTVVVALRLIGEPVPTNLPAPIFSVAISARWVTDPRIKVGDTLTAGGAIDGIGNPPSVFLAKAGDTMAGTLNMNNNRVTNLPVPVANTEAARKSDVDDARAYALSLAFNGAFPPMTGQAGRFLSNNGTAPAWIDIDTTVAARARRISLTAAGVI